MTETATKKAPIEWESQALRHLLTLAWPIVISMLSYAFMTLADTLFVGQVGQHALAGVGLGGISGFILICFPMGLLGAVKILVSQAVGAQRHATIPAFVGAGIYLASGLGLLVTLLGLGLSTLLPIFTATDASGEAASAYLATRILGAPAYLVRTAIEQARLGTGDSQLPMRVSVAANLANVALDYLLIIELGMGVEGAGIATTLSNVFGLGLMLFVQWKDGFGLRNARASHVRSVWSLGVPSGVQFSLEVGGYSAMVAILTYISERDAAANQIALQVLHFGFLPCFGFGEAGSVMAGQAVGAGRRDLVARVGRLALVPTLAYALLCSLIFVLFGRAIAQGFTDEPALVDLTAKLFLLAAIFQPADGVNIMARGVLKGAGDVRFTAWTGIMLTWAVNPPLTWLLGHSAGLGAVGGWLGLTTEVFVGAALFWLRLRGRGWHAAADRSLAQAAA